MSRDAARTSAYATHRPPLASALRYIQKVRFVLSGRQPNPSAILLVESGSREILERLIPVLRSVWGTEIPIDVFTCYAGLPRGFEPQNTRVFRAGDYRTREQRTAALRALKANGYTWVGIVCSGEPVLMKWKWALAFGLKAKVFIINENADYFWLDRMHLPIVFRLATERTGLAGAGAARTLARVFAFPFTLAYLLLYAAAVHGRRAIRGLVRQN
jgi:hypothetical protein